MCNSLHTWYFTGANDYVSVNLFLSTGRWDNAMGTATRPGLANFFEGVCPNYV